MASKILEKTEREGGVGSFRVGKEIKSFLYLFSARSLYSNIKFRAPQEATAIARAQYASHCDASVAFATEATRTKRSVACKILFYNIFTTFLYLPFLYFYAGGVAPPDKFFN